MSSDSTSGGYSEAASKLDSTSTKRTRSGSPARLSALRTTLVKLSCLNGKRIKNLLSRRRFLCSVIDLQPLRAIRVLPCKSSR
jgi:hypothetical protein